MTLPRLTEGGTVVCIAPGPSLTAEDVAYVRGKAVVIAVNDAIRIAPWADALHSSDQLWWARQYKAMRAFPGLKTRVCPSRHKLSMKVKPGFCEDCQRPKPAENACWCAGIVTLRNAGYSGISVEPGTICTTENSGGAAINLAVHLGAKRILLLGYDMGPDEKGRNHYHEAGPMTTRSPYMKFRKLIATMVDPLRELGIEVINCSRRTALECFPCRPLREVL